LLKALALEPSKREELVASGKVKASPTRETGKTIK
jgi:hypothetical protein